MEKTNNHSPGKNLHFVLIPWLAQGHIIPMIDIARLLAHRGVTVSLITTPANFLHIKPTADQIQESKLLIQFIPLLFPSADFGLPEGCENIDSLPSTSLAISFYNATKMLSQPLIDHLRSPKTIPPSCIISNYGHTWTVVVAREFNVPRLLFQGFSCFATLCVDNLMTHRTHETMSSDSESFVLPGLPQQIEITMAQLPAQFQAMQQQNQELEREITVSVLGSDVTVINSFDKLEGQYSQLWEKSGIKKAWMIGPVSLCSKGSKDLAERGNKASIDSDKCKAWLDSKSRLIWTRNLKTVFDPDEIPL